MRADARRNRERLLEAAATVFAEGGATASREAVAREAGVGIGTLYRHFPTREALYEAVYERAVLQLVELADTLAQRDAPTTALREWLAAFVSLVATKKGMAGALALTADRTKAISSHLTVRLTEALARLLDRAATAGRIRSDVGAEELLHAVVGMCLLQDQPGWQASVRRLTDLLVDGLCVDGQGAPKA
ncbi:TetR/AcrR family transcriptional regulator [Salinisphaera hydrothermalis]|uniref:Putative transcriptional regulatory protein TetR family n=1 Tax=Salinisphaera hydrothermalis (strain C41B8) TaxID=1304275 RepID=A0A084IL62_SALHC|nr:TetR/AcrR family transcriptional regulator [Salinisphaera hydrothermalis]KEZ77446.1 putative transcriptional regulatory protein TetR family [Salinisphaera hydrothermalis C41B8]